jgi:hypothetical protein
MVALALTAVLALPAAVVLLLLPLLRRPPLVLL